ncbi:MAG: chromosomal replication initiator protein DnaA [Deltaproteobacteria bacterium]|nr:chromosomal replication initiator protein DnaA [Deltaproteobacteria bacterium]
MNDTIQKVIASLQTKISGLNYNNWIKPATFRLGHDQRLAIEVPNKFIRDWITENYLNLIKYELFKVTGQEHEVAFRIVEESASAPEAVSEPLEAEAPAAGVTEAPGPKKPQEGLNPKYTFDTFVVGNSNQFAHAASRAVANLPSLAYNPLFIYGGVGLGKTHLLNAVGLEIHRTQKQLKVLYVHAEHFTNELINSIRYEKMFEFRKKYRESCDVLLIDDIQFIAGKERTQEEFFHTFNYLYESRRQVVVTSDRFPKDIPQLEERLRSRFEWGLIADIQAPDTETRVAILRKKAEEDRIALPDEVAMFLATHIRNNVRELEGSLIRLSAFSSLSGNEISVEMAREILKNLIPDRSRALTIEAIQKLVADHYNVKISDLKSPRRLKVLTVPRQIAMYLCRKHVKSSFPELGMKFGGKDHSTVVHAVQKIEKLLQQDLTLRNEIHSLEKILQTEIA